MSVVGQWLAQLSCGAIVQSARGVGVGVEDALWRFLDCQVHASRDQSAGALGHQGSRCSVRRGSFLIQMRSMSGTG